MSNTDRDRGADASIYNRLTLRAYDTLVLGLTNRRIWKCPTPLMVDQYRTLAGAKHLDIGPGTGYYLEDMPSTEITLLDLNSASLAASEARIGESAKVTALNQSFFDPIDPSITFDSIAAQFLLHCIPGKEKWQRLSQLKENLVPGGVLFGSTVIPQPSTQNKAARRLNAFYNRVGVFGNVEDMDSDLEGALQGWADVTITRHGQVMLFSARRPPIS